MPRLSLMLALTLPSGPPRSKLGHGNNERGLEASLSTWHGLLERVRLSQLEGPDQDLGGRRVQRCQLEGSQGGRSV